MELAEKKDDMSFVIKGNGLKRKSEESKKEMQALEKQTTELESKRKLQVGSGWYMELL